MPGRKPMPASASRRPRAAASRSSPWPYISRAKCWGTSPPLPSSIGGFAIRDVRDVSLELLVERFGPVFEACKKYGTKFGLECHPTERAMGDLESAGDFLRAMEKAGFGGVVGFNFDSSHMEWQNV